MLHSQIPHLREVCKRWGLTVNMLKWLFRSQVCPQQRPAYFILGSGVLDVIDILLSGLALGSFCVPFRCVDSFNNRKRLDL